MTQPILRRIQFDGGGRNRFPASGIRTAEPLWVPSDVNTLRLWLKPETLYDPLEFKKDGNAVGSIDDQSGQDNTATQTTTTKRPLWKANIAQGYPSLLGDGVDDLLAVNSLASLFSGSDKALTLCACFKLPTGLEAGALLALANSASTNNGLFRLGFVGGVFTSYRKDDAGSSVTQSSTATIGSAVAIVTYNFTGTTITIRKNAAAVVSAAAMDVGTTTLDRAAIFAQPAHGAAAEANQLNGHLVELFVYAASLTAAEIDSAEAYLNRRYAAY